MVKFREIWKLVNGVTGLESELCEKCSSPARIHDKKIEFLEETGLSLLLNNLLPHRASCVTAPCQGDPSRQRLTTWVLWKSGFLYLFLWTRWKRRKINSWPRHESSSAVQSASGLRWESRASCCVYALGSLWWHHYRERGRVCDWQWNPNGAPSPRR